MISWTARPFAVAAACLALTAGVVLPASAAQAGSAATAACTFVPAEGGSTMDAPAVADRFWTPAAVPAGATAFTSPDGFGGREYMIGPAAGTCVAHGGLDQDFNQEITEGGYGTVTFEQVFGTGGDYQLPYGCRYLPKIRKYADPDSRTDCAPPPATEHITAVKTGLSTLPAAVVLVEPNVKDPQLKASGTDPVLAVVLAFDLGGDSNDPTYRAVTTSYADCRLTPATANLCVASLQAFATEAITFQAHYVNFPQSGNPAKKLRHALANYKTQNTRRPA